MKLMISANESYVLILDTKSKKIERKTLGNKGIVGALCYSGETIVVAVSPFIKPSTSISQLMFLKGGKVQAITECLKSIDIQSIVSPYDGKLYVASMGTDCLCSIEFNSDFKITEDIVHFDIGDNIIAKCGFNCVVNHNGRWYGSLQGTGDGGTVLEFANQRVIYSGTNKANSILFSNSERLCFCECGKFVQGDIHTRLEGMVSGAIEDIARKGFWVGNEGKLTFIDYAGYTGESIDLTTTKDIHTIIQFNG